MGDDASLGSTWATLYSSGTLTGLALLGLIVIIVVFAAQLEALFSACRNLIAYRHQLVNNRKSVV